MRTLMVDFLKECMSDVGGKLGHVVPINEFNQAFCVVCVNKECSRSRSNNLLFSRRAQDWHRDLFINIPRAKDGDSQYDGIRSRKFISANIIHSPQDVNQNISEESKINPIERKLNIEFKSESESESELNLCQNPPSESELNPESESKLNPESKSKSIPRMQPQPDMENTPFVQGTVLSNNKSEEIFLEPGQSYIFGSDDKTSKT